MKVRGGIRNASLRSSSTFRQNLHQFDQKNSRTIHTSLLGTDHPHPSRSHPLHSHLHSERHHPSSARSHLHTLDKNSSTLCWISPTEDKISTTFGRSHPLSAQFTWLIHPGQALIHNRIDFTNPRPRPHPPLARSHTHSIRSHPYFPRSFPV